MGKKRNPAVLMITPVLKLRITFIILPLVFALPVLSQICINKYTAVTFKGTTYDTFTRALITPNNEIISAGTLFDYNKAGHVAKYSEKGSLIWSYIYKVDFFDFIKLIFFKKIKIADIISTVDGGIIIAGSVGQGLGNYAPVKKWALMAKLDKFGKVLWTKTLNGNGQMSFTNLYQTTDGDIIAYLATDNGLSLAYADHTYNKIIRLTPAGEIKWTAFLLSGIYDAGGMGLTSKKAITQTTNKNIVIGDVLINPVRVTDNFKVSKGFLRLISLDYTTGKKVWEKAYEYPVSASDSSFVPDINDIAVLPEGKLSIATSLYVSTPGNPAFSKKGVTIITSSEGEIEKTVAYYSADGVPSSIISANTNNTTGIRTYLFNKNGEAIISLIKNDGSIASSKGFNDEGGLFPVNCYAAGPNGYAIFMSNFSSFYFRMLVTDADGNITCVNTPGEIIAENITLNYPKEPVITTTQVNPEREYYDYYDYAHPLKRDEEYLLERNIQCQEISACCKDFIDTLNIPTTNICEGETYLLPDNTVVKDSGTYYVTFKTLLGCDSIRFYRLNTDKNPSKLTLGEDVCFNGKDSLVINATGGYQTYNWMNKPTKASYYVAKKEGVYWVKVTNTCGSNTDSIHVYDLCEVPVFMPTIFSPNRDRLNDTYNYSKLNRNRFISLSIYNRWGQLVFKSYKRETGWNGQFKNREQSAGIYLYYLETETLNGKRVTHKGSFLLNR